MDFFRKDYQIENYISKHMFGLVKERKRYQDMTPDMSVTAVPEGMDRDTTFIKKKIAYKKDVAAVGKLGPMATFLALVKGYCAIVILIVPKSFANGGYIFSPLAMLISYVLTTVCALKLVQSGLKTRYMSYSLIG